MAAYVLPAFYALFLWWFSTGAILYLDGLPRRTFKWSMIGAAAVTAGAFYGLDQSSDDSSIGGTYAAFTCGLLIWAWQQISFYTGYLTGPRKVMCREGCSGWPHFGHALQANLYHETSIALSLGLCLVLTWGAPNQIGLWTFLILWWMHESARLNVFLGVRNVTEEFLPEHMAFLKSFLNKKPMNLLFPFSVTVSTLATMWVAQLAWAAPTQAEAAGFSFLTALMALAVLEHWFLVLPLPAERLWDWGLSSRQPAPDSDAPPPGDGHHRRSDTASAPNLQTIKHKNGQRTAAANARREASMDYNRIFDDRLGQIHAEGRYRVFADLKRRCGAYPQADQFADGQARPVTVWCS
ncbi:putative photosynthetic complex assembly protein PuhE, partial [Rhodomicrobium vannielii]|uniref:putative photosynthetic complex assembly protein PuhE n=1 Tax=Rhodomicrobium vannielii TaxID=1069 RepID=UPI0011250914